MKIKVFAMLGVVLILTACAGRAAMETSESFAPVQNELDFAGEPALESAAPDTFSSSELKGSTDRSEEDEGRLVIKNASLSIVVEDPGSTMDAISALAADLGGFVVSSNLYQTQTDRGLEVPQANITIRVPADKMDQALEIIKTGAGQILSEVVTGEDVTQEFTDLSSRLRNLEITQQQLTEIMEEAYRTEDVLNVYNRLVEVQEEIELIKGQMQYYQQAAALSAISVSIQANEAVQPLKIGSWQPVGVAKRAIRALINTLEFFLDALIWIVLYIVPVVLILYFPIRWGWKRLSRLARRRKKNQKKDESEE